MAKWKAISVQMGCWIVILAVAPGALSQASAQQMPQAAEAGSLSPAAVELPDSPGAVFSKAQPAASGPVVEAQTIEPPSVQVQQQAASGSEAQAPAQKPVGTAAAGVIPATGVAASQPAGVAIAPVKQRRVRTIVLRVGAIIGAGVAVGSVVALTEATPSKPPGAH